MGSPVSAAGNNPVSHTFDQPGMGQEMEFISGIINQDAMK